MKKLELKKMKALKATPGMMRMAAQDTPQKNESYYSTSIRYNNGMYLRALVENGILKVAFYLPEHMRTGGRNPVYELFIDRERKRFITYACLVEKWLTAKVDILSWPYSALYSDTKWVSKADDAKIRNYLGNQYGGGFDGILKYQRKLREDELVARHKRETDKWDADLQQVPKLPKDWNRWVSKVGIPENYIFYEYRKGGATTGYCSFCDKDVPIKKPRFNKKGKCSRCGKDIVYKSVGKAGRLFTSTHRVYLLQRCKDGFVARLFECYRSHLPGQHTKPECSCSEIRRTIYNHRAQKPRSYYYGFYKYRTYRWIRGDVCGTSWWYLPNYGIYGKTLPCLSDNELRYTGFVEAGKILGTFAPEHYLAIYYEFPQIEKFAKAGLGKLVHECMNDYRYVKQCLLRYDPCRLTEMLGVNNQELKRLREHNGGRHFLRWLQVERAMGKQIPDEIILWFCKNDVEYDDVKFIIGRMSIVQIHNYIRRQMKAMKATPSQVLNTWGDYLSMAKRLGWDINDSIIYRVNKLRQRHDELVDMLQGDKSIALMAGEILVHYPHVEEIYASIKPKYEYGDDEYTIVVPTRIEEVMHEGRALHHCVDSSERYWERIERRESFVFFLRKSAAVDTPYYTLEVEPNGTIRQKRTKFDRQEADIEDATKFLTKWQSIIATRLTKEDRALAEKSKELRLINFEQLRRDKVLIYTGDLHGTLLIDALMADLMETAA